MWGVPMKYFKYGKSACQSQRISENKLRSYDKIALSNLYQHPQLVNETPSDEFTRMYYVACSRAKEDLYIHIQTGCSPDIIEKAITAFVAQTEMQIAYEVIS